MEGVLSCSGSSAASAAEAVTRDRSVSGEDDGVCEERVVEVSAGCGDDVGCWSSCWTRYSGAGKV